MPQFQSYIICTSRRSGSTLLCKLLAATGVAGNPNSYFHNPSVSGWLRSLDLTADSGCSEPDTLRRIFDAVQQRGTGGDALFGLRLQGHSMAYFAEQLVVLHPNLPNDRARFRAAFGETLFIHLSRENKLDQAISCVKARQTGLWHRHADGREMERSAPAKPLIYDAAEIARELAELSHQDQTWVDWFAAQNIAPLRLGYDRLAADPQGVLAGVLDRLGLNPAAADGITPPVAKLADATNRDWAARFAKGLPG